MEPCTLIDEQIGLNKESYLKLIRHANNQLQRINVLIVEYNAASEPQKTEILFEIEAYRTFIINTVGSDFIETTVEFIGPIEFELYEMLQREFALRDQSMQKARLDAYDVSYLHDSEKQGALESVFSGQDTSLLTSCFGSDDTKSVLEIKDLIQQIGSMTEDRSVHLALKRLKNLLRVYTAETALSVERISSIRGVVAGINGTIDALEKKNPQLKEAVPAGFLNFPDFLANLPPRKAAKLMRILDDSKSTRQDWLNNQLNNFYDPTREPEQTRMFRTLLDKYSIRFLGGNNSKQFKVTALDHSAPDMVLKVDNRMGNPKKVEAFLEQSRLEDVLTRKYLDHTVFFPTSADKSKWKMRGLILTEYCPYGDLDSLSRRLDIHKRLSMAASIYLQMADALRIMGDLSIGFPDPKNSNWLFDSQRYLRLSDTKSFLPANGDRLDRRYYREQGYKPIFSMHMLSPELIDLVDGNIMSMSTDSLHCYLLGKNLYAFLTSCNSDYLCGQRTVSTYDFSQTVFRGRPGQDFKELIIDLMHVDTNKRITSMSEAIVRLNNIELLRLKMNCELLIKAVIKDPKPFQEQINAASSMEQFRQIQRDCTTAAKDQSRVLLNILVARGHPVATVHQKQLGAQIDADSDISDIAKTYIELLDCCIEDYEMKLKATATAVPFTSRPSYQELIGAAAKKAKDFGALNELIKLEKQIHFQVTNKEVLRGLLSDLKACSGAPRFGPDDSILDDINEQIKRIYSVTKVDDLDAIRTAIKGIQDSMNAPPVRAAFALIQKYREKQEGTSSTNDKAKAEALEAAFARIPVRLRDKVGTDLNNLPSSVTLKQKEALDAASNLLVSDQGWADLKAKFAALHEEKKGPDQGPGPGPQ